MSNALSTFFNTDAGLNLTLKGKPLYPVQLFLLKLILGYPLDDTEVSIPLIRDSKDPSSGYWYMTETEFYNFLKSEGRVSGVRTGGVRSYVVISSGRRSTKSTLTFLLAAYLNRELLRTSSQAYKQGLIVTAFETLSRLQGSYVKEYQDTVLEPMLYPPFNSKSIHLKNSTSEVRQYFISGKSAQPFRGLTPSYAIFDEASLLPDLNLYLQALVPSLVTMGGPLVLFGTVNSKSFEDQYNYAWEDSEGLAISLHSWELNSSLNLNSCSHYSEYKAPLKYRKL